MKKLSTYICEALQTKISKWIADVYDTMSNLIKDNKIVPLDVDTTKLNKPDKDRFKFKDFMNDKNVKNIVNNKLIGFPISSQMAKMEHKTLVDKNPNEEKQLDPECLPYWFVDNSNNIYFVGLVIFDPTVSYLDEFIHILNIEASLCVKDPKTLLKGIYNDFTLHYVNEKIGKYKGVSAKPTNPKVKATLLRLGFRAIPDNKDILTMKI